MSDCIGTGCKAAAMQQQIAELREQLAAAQGALLKFAVRLDLGKCYVCDTSWTEGAPDIHNAGCPLARDGHVVDVEIAGRNTL